MSVIILKAKIMLLSLIILRFLEQDELISFDTVGLGVFDTLKTVFSDTLVIELFETNGLKVAELVSMFRTLPQHVLIDLIKKKKTPHPLNKKLYYRNGIGCTNEDSGILAYNFDSTIFDLLGNLFTMISENSITLYHVNSDVYLRLNLDAKKRKKIGAFNTPSPIANFVTESVMKLVCEPMVRQIDTSLQKNNVEHAIKIVHQMNELKIIDPSCGSGIFLEYAFHTLFEYNIKIITLIKQHLINTPNKIKSKKLGALIDVNYITIGQTILKNTLYGVDSNPLQILITGLRLHLSLLKLGKRDASLNAFNDKNLFPHLDTNLKCFDSLLWDEENTSIKNRNVNAIVWEVVFPSVFKRKNPGFDIILTNPPFLPLHGRHKKTISPAILSFYRKKYQLFGKKRANVYLFFIELWLTKLLRKKGYLGFIIDQAFRDLPSYSFERKYLLSHYQIHMIVPSIAFPNAAVDVSLFILQNTKPKDKIKWLEEIERPEKAIEIEPHAFYQNINSSFIYSKFTPLIKKIEETPFLPLGGEYGLCNISCGLEYGALLKKYFLSATKMDETFHPALDGAEDIPEPYLNCWYPHKGANAYVRFSKAFEQKLREKGKDRTATGKKVILASGNEKRFLNPKIILRQTANRFIGIIDDLSSPHGPFYSLRNTHVLNLKEKYRKQGWNLEYILGILNSKLMTLYGKEKNIIRTYGNYRHPQIRIKDLLTIPIAIPDESQKKHIFHFFKEKVQKLSTLKRTLALLEIFFAQKLMKDIFEDKTVLTLDEITSPSSTKFWLQKVLDIKDVLVKEITIPTTAKKTKTRINVQFESQRSLSIEVHPILPSKNRKKLKLTVTFFEYTTPQLIDSLYLLLKCTPLILKTKNSIKNFNSKKYPLLILPPTNKKSTIPKKLTTCLELAWKQVSQETAAFPTSIFLLRTKIQHLENQLENKVLTLYGLTKKNLEGW